VADEQDVREIALSLPQTAQDPNGFRFLVGKKAFAWSWMKRIDPKKPRVRQSDVLAVRVADEWDKQAMLALDSEKFFTEPHYDGFPAVLVNLPRVDAVELTDLLIAAWRVQAPRALVKEFDSGQRYGTAEVSESGIDLSQLRRNLQLTPTERVEQMVAFVRAVLPLQGAARRARR
jgi:hypothetical protein